MPWFGSMDYAVVEQAGQRRGLIVRGGFHPTIDDHVPALPDGGASRALILLGNAGPAMWALFNRSPEFSDGESDPMNRWSERIIAAIAEEVGATALFPFGGPPHLPFMKWAQQAESVYSSPIGMLIHPEYGLWHAYRGALSFGERIDLPPRSNEPRPCDSCADQPCLSTCPVNAFTNPGYDVDQCVKHISSPKGRDCIHGSCRARSACPVGTRYQYEAPQAQFHMEAFRMARSAGDVS